MNLMNAADLLNQNAADMAAAVRGGHVTATALAHASLERIAATQARVNAFTDVTAKRALQTAADLDTRLAIGDSTALALPLLGVPFAVKNLFDVADLTTLAGSKIERGKPVATADAPLVARMQAAGAVLVGALNMDEYAYGFTTENTHYGATHNPHDLSRIAGGSSGGSGAAVAAGQVPITLGSDTNGSIRVPASLCGVWGLKPTFGRLSRRGTYPFVYSIDHLGPMASTLGGLALAYDALQCPDPLDTGCHALEVQPVVPQLSQGMEGLQGLRIGVLGGYFHNHASPAAREVVGLAAKTLGAQDEVIWPDAALSRAAAFIITASEGGSLHLNDLRTRADEFEPLSVDRFISGTLQPADWTIKAHRVRRMVRDKVNALFKDWDILLTAATPVSASLIGAEWLDINGTQHPARAAMGLLTQPISFAGCPVVAAPMWPTTTGGMPIGVQIIAAPWREDLAFRAAHVLSSAGAAHTISPRAL